MSAGLAIQLRPRRPWKSALTVLGLGVAGFAVGMALHESFHALAVLLLGAQPQLVLRPWPLALLPVSITGIHVQPVPPLDPTRQFIDNLFGPAAAALVFGLVARRLPPGALRKAAVATTLGLLFFALIEPLDVALDGRLDDPGFLTAPEFNYGVPLLILMAVAGTSLRPPRGTPDQRRHVSSGTTKT